MDQCCRLKPLVLDYTPMFSENINYPVTDYSYQVDVVNKFEEDFKKYKKQKTMKKAAIGGGLLLLFLL